MKKIKLMAAAAIMAVVATAGYIGYTAYEYATMTPQERLILANIEALTKDEYLWDCENGCLDEAGAGCACYIWYPYVKEKDWN